MTDYIILDTIYQTLAQKYGYEFVKKYDELGLVTVNYDGRKFKIEVKD